MAKHKYEQLSMNFARTDIDTRLFMVRQLFRNLSLTEHGAKIQKMMLDAVLLNTNDLIRIFSTNKHVHCLHMPETQIFSN